MYSLDKFSLYSYTKKILFTSSNYYLCVISNIIFILFYYFILLINFEFIYFILGLMCWSMWEYIYHRYLMHFTNSGKLYYLIHGHHHMYPDKKSIHLPLFQYFIVLIPFYVFLKFIFLLNHNQNINYTLGHLFALFFFENIHKEIHNPYWITDKNAGFRISHMYHHNKNKNKAFCFTSPLFDILFGTFPNEVLSYNFIALLPIPYLSYIYGTYSKPSIHKIESNYTNINNQKN